MQLEIVLSSAPLISLERILDAHYAVCEDNKELLKYVNDRILAEAKLGNNHCIFNLLNLHPLGFNGILRNFLEIMGYKYQEDHGLLMVRWEFKELDNLY